MYKYSNSPISIRIFNVKIGKSSKNYQQSTYCLKYQEIVNNKNKALKLFTYIVYSKHMDVITPPLKSPTPSAYKHRCGQLHAYYCSRTTI